MKSAIKQTVDQIRTDLISRGSEIELLDVSECGAVHVKLFGACCAEHTWRLKTLQDIEAALKSEIPGVRIVMEAGY